MDESWGSVPGQGLWFLQGSGRDGERSLSSPLGLAKIGHREAEEPRHPLPPDQDRPSPALPQYWEAASINKNRRAGEEAGKSAEAGERRAVQLALQERL